MAEPASTVYLPLSVAAAFASLFPGIDGNALIGAFAGAALIVVTSKDLTIFKRFAYLVISLVIGYQGGPEIINATPIKSTGVASFFAAAIAITLALQLVERIKAFDLLSVFKKGS